MSTEPTPHAHSLDHRHTNENVARVGFDFSDENPAMLPYSLQRMAQTFAKTIGFSGGCIRANGLGALVWQSSAGEAATHWLAADRDLAHPTGHDRRTRSRGHHEVAWQSLAMSYASRPIGELRLHEIDEKRLSMCAVFARRCGYLIKRNQVLRWSHERLGRPLLLAEASVTLRRLEALIETAASNELPMLLKGESDAEKAIVAVAIHCGHVGLDAPFIEIMGNHPVGDPSGWFERARGGTLFINGIDKMPLALQVQLSRHIHSQPQSWSVTPTANAVRLIASSTDKLETRAIAGTFSRSLLAALDFLSITVPPLHGQIDDIDNLNHDASDTKPNNAVPVETQAAPLRQWVDGALGLDPSKLQRLHPSLRKALQHLGRNYAEPISLTELAASAHVSPSHLGFLFRSIVGSSFKQLLQAIRLEQAKTLLRDDPHQRITEVALNVGFRDLSHFEKSFRRAVGLTPRQFRASC